MATAKEQAQITALLAEVASAIRPQMKMDVVEWCERYRMLSPEASNEVGPWRLSRSPYVGEIMRACEEPDVPEVIIMGGSQVAKSEIELNLIAYRAVNDPAPSLLLTDNLISAKTLSEDRLMPMFRDSPILTPLVRLDKGPASESSTYKFVYPGGNLHLVGSNSSSGVSMRPIKYLYIDEADRCSAETTSKEGDPVGMARLRLSTYPNRKVLMVSSPTISGLSRIESAFLRSMQEYWFLPCSQCGLYQRLAWARLSYETAQMTCERCQEASGQAAWLRGQGEWRTAKLEENGQTPRVRGFHIPALLSSFLRWEELIEEHHEAKRLAEEHDHSKLKTFVTGRWGEPWVVPSIEVKEHELSSRREPYDAELPEGVKLIIGGIDTQDNSLEYLTVGVGDRHEFWCLDRGAIMGDLEKDFAAMYKEVDERVIGRLWETREGKLMSMAVAAQDSGGHHAASVYLACRQRSRRLLAYRGGPSTYARALYKLNRHDEHGVRMLLAATDAGKDLLFTRLRNTVTAAGYIHFPLPDQWHQGFDDSFFEELTSEKKEIEWRNGQRIARWKKKKSHPHNEALDLSVMVLILFEALQQPLEKRRADYLPDWVKKPAAETADASNGSAVPPAASPPPPPRQRRQRIWARNPWGPGGLTHW